MHSDSEDEVEVKAHASPLAVGKEQQASAAQRHPTHEIEETTKPARGECGTPGSGWLCDLADFHLGGTWVTALGKGAASNAHGSTGKPEPTFQSPESEHSPCRIALYPGGAPFWAR